MLWLVHGSLLWVLFPYWFCRSIKTSSFIFFSCTFSCFRSQQPHHLLLQFYQQGFDLRKISSLKKARRLSKALFSILGDLALEGHISCTSWSRNSNFSTTTGEIKPSLTFPELSWRLFLLFWLLVVDILMKSFVWVFFIDSWLIDLTEKRQSEKIQNNYTISKQKIESLGIWGELYLNPPSIIWSRIILSIASEQIEISCIWG